jgi:hypothetical protein
VRETRVLRIIFGSKREEVKGRWRILHDDDFRNCSSSSNIIIAIESKRMRWAGNIARM